VVEPPFSALLRAGGGGVEVVVIRQRRDAAALVCGVLAGERRAVDIARLVAQWPRRPSGRALCLCCPRSVGGPKLPAAFLAVIPCSVEAGAAALIGVCRRCLAGHTDAELIEALAAGLRRDGANDLRVVGRAQVARQAGHA
jgi:hypothetical protein